MFPLSFRQVSVRLPLGFGQVSVKFPSGFGQVSVRFRLGFRQVSSRFRLGFHYVFVSQLPRERNGHYVARNVLRQFAAEAISCQYVARGMSIQFPSAWYLNSTTQRGKIQIKYLAQRYLKPTTQSTKCFSVCGEEYLVTTQRGPFQVTMQRCILHQIRIAEHLNSTIQREEFHMKYIAQGYRQSNIVHGIFVITQRGIFHSSTVMPFQEYETLCLSYRR